MVPFCRFLHEKEGISIPDTAVVCQQNKKKGNVILGLHIQKAPCYGTKEVPLCVPLEQTHLKYSIYLCALSLPERADKVGGI